MNYLYKIASFIRDTLELLNILDELRSVCRDSFESIISYKPEAVLEMKVAAMTPTVQVKNNFQQVYGNYL